MHIIVLPGDGIGPEITAASLDVLAAAQRRFGLELKLEEELVGHASLKKYGTTVLPDLLDRVKAAQGLILGPTATLDFKDPSKGEINPSMYFRKSLDLYANIRPAKTYEGVPNKVGPFDLVVARENTEGFYSDRNMEDGNAELLVTKDVVVSLRRITRLCCERIAREAFKLARQRRKKVSIVHKANVLKRGDGMFIESVRKIGLDYPDVAIDDYIFDAVMAHVVRDPAKFDVIVTTNLFGDTLSDLTAELSGSLGLGGSINAGDDYAMAQAAHGSAPDIAGQDKANPSSLIISCAMLLRWLGERHGQPVYGEAANAIEKAVADAVAAGEVTRDVGGRNGTRAAGKAIAARIG